MNPRLVPAAFVAALGLAAGGTGIMTERPLDLLVRNARVVHGDGRVTPLADVGIRGGVIAWVRQHGPGPVTPLEAPPRRELDAGGRTVIPGLIDAHVHVEPWTLPLFLQYGVTTVRDVHNDPAYILPLARDDDPARPRIVAAGALIDGPGSFWKNAEQVATLGEARAAVRRQIAGGARLIKVYTRLEPALLSAIVADAKARGIPVAAHLGMTSAVQAAENGVTSIEHLTGIPESIVDDPDRLMAAHRDFLGGWTAFELAWPDLPRDRLAAVAATLRAFQVVIVPTLALHEAFSRLADPDLLGDPALADVPAQVLKQAWDPADIMGRARWTPAVLARFKVALPVMQRFVATYARLGGQIAAGTDTPQQFVVPGASLHRELELYVGAGLSPAEALRTATVEAASLLGIEREAGTIDAGRSADLVILDADPLRDIRNTRRIWMVIRGGLPVRRVP